MSKINQQRFSNFDVFAITRELNEILNEGTISNIYEVEDLLLLKISTYKGKKTLIVKSDSRINLTNYDYPIPKFPSQYIMSLRKFLKNKKILNISQHDFDRIIVFELSDYDSTPWQLVIELFNKGNYILLDQNNLIKVAKKYKKFRDRDVLANREYTFPKSFGLDFLTLNKSQFKELFSESDAEIVRHLARNVNISGLYSEEVCLRAGVDKTSLGRNLTDEQLDNLFKAFKNMRNELLFGQFKAKIVLDNTGNQMHVIPFDLGIFNQYEMNSFESFNEAVDTFYSKIDSERILAPSDEKVKQKIAAQEKILKNQLDYLEELKKKKEQYYTIGDFIYNHFNDFQKLISVILDAEKKGYPWDQIDKKLADAKASGLEGSEFFVKIIPSRKELVVKIKEFTVHLHLRRSIGENANLIYAKGKKAIKKIDGTNSAIEKTKEKIKNLELEKESIEAEIDFLVKKPKKKWFEKYRWFKSSDGFLIIGGRDASSNETIYRKHLESNDLVLHTNFPGSPLTIIKNPENEIIPKDSINEAANFVASYSRAWKESWGIVDVFHVSPDQVSKTPPSGEFLPKGSFVITGKKEFIKNAKIQLAIGLIFNTDNLNDEDENEVIYPELISGPISAIKSKTDKYVVIVPDKSGLSKGKLAKQIKAHFIKISKENMKKWINLLSVDEINLLLPTGNSKMKI